MDELDGLPVSRGAAPTLRMLCFGGLINFDALKQQGGIRTRMALGRDDEADSAVTMLLVVPVNKCTDPLAWQRTAFGLIDLPADDLSAKDIHEQNQVKSAPRDLCGEIRDVPTEQLMGCRGTERTRLVALLCGPFGTAVLTRVFGAQDAVKGRFRSEVSPAIRKTRNDLAGDR
jgi:hypothetical protein